MLGPNIAVARAYAKRAGRVDVDFPWQRLTGEPLIYASMGTLQNGLESVFRAVVEAAARHRNVQLVLSIGGCLDLDQIGPLPGNAVVVRHAPQLELLKRASVCITHAGLNTGSARSRRSPRCYPDHRRSAG